MTGDRPRTPPAERFDVGSLVLDLAAEVASLRAEPGGARHGHRQKTLYKHGGRTLALFVMEAGAVLPEHAAAGTVSVQPIEGEILMRVAGAESRLAPGHVMVMPPRVRHDVRAETPAAFLLQVSLGPGSP
ncbi:MAG TPA: cupin domain-containing protein [Phycisphaerales bacterium]|nr:cupin domain-containing protein [Phycisphaerales bacterium]